jgi:hypothetical protein
MSKNLEEEDSCEYPPFVPGVLNELELSVSAPFGSRSSTGSATQSVAVIDSDIDFFLDDCFENPFTSSEVMEPFSWWKRPPEIASILLDTMLEDETRPIAPLLAEEQFPSLYRQSLFDYFKRSFDNKNGGALKYLTSYTEPCRGKAFEKFCPTLHRMHQDYLDPKAFDDRHNGTLYKWEFQCQVPRSRSGLGTMERLHVDVCSIKDLTGSAGPPLPEGVSVLMSLLDQPLTRIGRVNPYTPTPTWKAWFSIHKSLIFKGNGLFAAREFQEGQVLGFYVGYILHTSLDPWVARATDEFLRKDLGALMDDSKTMSVMNKTGHRVQVNPCYRSDKISDNVSIDDRGALIARHRIASGAELLLPYDGRSQPQRTKHLPSEEEKEEEEEEEDTKPKPQTRAETTRRAATQLSGKRKNLPKAGSPRFGGRRERNFRNDRAGRGPSPSPSLGPTSTTRA